ncbi:hypothetical protein MMPV_002040 [Pyropia vietnamensis]
MDFGEDRATVDRMDWAADAVAGPPTPLLFVSVARPYMASLERSYRRALARDDAAAVAVAVEAAAFAQRAVAVFHAIDALYGDGLDVPVGGQHVGERRSTSRRPGASGVSSLLWSATGSSGERRRGGGGDAGTSAAGSARSEGAPTTPGSDGRRRAPASVAAAEQLAAAVRRDDPGRFSPAEAAAVPYLLRAKARLFEAVRSGDAAAVRALTLACEEALEQAVGSGNQFVLTVPGQGSSGRPTVGAGAAAAGVAGGAGLMAQPSFGRGGAEETEDIVAVDGQDDSDMEDPTGGVAKRGVAGGDANGTGGRFTGSARWIFLRRLLTCELLRVSKTASIVTFLYILLAIASVAAIVVITIQFAEDVRNPESGIELVRHNELSMPVVTVCSTQTGVPLRRLQFFDFRNARGVNVKGPLPNEVLGSDEFENAVDRYWDNPDGEDCDRICGNFFPLPVVELQKIANGSLSTKCRPCFRTGSKGPEVVANSTAFSASAYMNLFTDHAFFQCMFRAGGADRIAEDSMRQTVAQPENPELFFGGPNNPTILSIAPGQEAIAIGNLTSKELCNTLYFAAIPRDLNASNVANLPDIQYTFNGSTWLETGDGPYFQSPAANLRAGSPEEGLQVFITARGAEVPEGGVTSLSDTALLGPNSEANILFSRRQEDGKLRFTISSISSSNNLKVEPAPFSGYWLNYAVHLGYASFVEEVLKDVHTYPVTQWLVDVAGYIGLFTGASLFSIMVVPLLQLLRRRDRRESLAVRPLDTLYSPYHHVRASRVTPGVMGDLAATLGAGGDSRVGGGLGSGAGPATPGGLP